MVVVARELVGGVGASGQQGEQAVDAQQLWYQAIRVEVDGAPAVYYQMPSATLLP